jgi:hypothetical protein
LVAADLEEMVEPLDESPREIADATELVKELASSHPGGVEPVAGRSHRMASTQT